MFTDLSTIDASVVGSSVSTAAARTARGRRERSLVVDAAALLRRREEEAGAREKGEGKEMRWSEPWWEMARARRAWERAREEVEAIGLWFLALGRKLIVKR